MVDANHVAGVGGAGSPVGAGGGATSGTGQGAPVDVGGEGSVAGDAGAAGASPAVVALPFRSGSRLKARYVDGGGDARWFTGFFDTELQIECAFRRAADGEIRCLPAESVFTSDFSGAYFADATCGTPVLTNAVLHQELVLLDPDFCPGPGVAEPPVRVVATGAAEAPRQVYRRNLENVCVLHDVLLPVVATSEVQPSRFVKAIERQPAAPSARLQPIRLEGEDGSYEAPGFWDEERKEPCRLASEGWDVGLPDVCISARQSQAFESCYAEPAHTTPLVGSEPQCRYPSLVANWESDSCMLSGWTKSIYEVGALFKDSYVISVDVYCSNLTNLYAPAYRRGAALPWSSFPSLDMVELGTGRLKLRVGSVDAIAAHHYRDIARPGSFNDAQFYDSELGVPCHPYLSPDGTRCMPLDTVGSSEFVTFSDAQCTQPAAYVDPSELSASCEPRRRFYLADPNFGDSVSSGRPIRLYEFGTPSAGPSYKKSGTDCVLADWPTAPLIPMALADLAPLVTEGTD